MKAQLRVCRYKMGWLGWSAYYQGENPPLCQALPHLENLTDEGNKTSRPRIFQARTPETREGFTTFLRDVLLLVVQGGEQSFPEKWVRNGLLWFHQKATKITVDDILVESPDHNGWWHTRAKWMRNPIDGKLYDMTNRIKKGWNLPEAPDDVLLS